MATLIQDPVVFYLVVNDELQMSHNTIVVQASHLVEMFLLQYMRLLALSVKKDRKLVPDEELIHIKLTNEWIHQSSQKVALKANKDQWSEIKTTFGRNAFVIKDACKFQSDSETVIGIWPMHQSNAPDILQRLQPL